MIVLEIICVLLLIVVGILVFKVLTMRRAAKEIKEGVEKQLTGDTNGLITISSGDKYMRLLAADINRQLKELVEERRRFQSGNLEIKETITNVSHDLRTPLTAISGYLDLLEREDISEQVSEYAVMIRNRTNALRKLMEELFRYSVYSLEEKEPVYEDLSLNAALEEAVGEYYGALTTARIIPEIVIPEEPIIRRVDREFLSRIFGNILSNVVKYSEGDLKIVLDEKGQITFANKAPGLDAVTVGRLFERFYTVETARGSTGLGLSIAKLLCEKMNAGIGAEYEEGVLMVKVSF